MTFKVGDRVRVVRGFHGARIHPFEPQLGEEAVVTGLCGDDLKTRFGSWQKSRLELIEDRHTDADLAMALDLAKLIMNDRWFYSRYDNRGVYIPSWLRDCVADELRRRS